MLRMSTESNSENLSGLHYPQYSIGADSLHRLGQTFIQVRRTLLCIKNIPVAVLMYLRRYSQLFGEVDDDEDVSPDTADPEAAGDAGEQALTENANAQVCNLIK